MSMDTATILDLLKTRIEALTPSTQASSADRFQVVIGVSKGLVGKRAVELTAEGGIRKPRGGQTCTDWETTIEITTLYPDSPAAVGERGVYSHAMQDVEDVLDDLYLWGTTTSGILKVEPSTASVENTEGAIETIRSIFIQFERS